MAQISAEQLQQLIEAVRLASSTTTSAAANVAKANFLHCTERFYGGRTYEIVEEFISNITLYKDVTGMSDEDAFKSVPILFAHEASTWWQGVSKEAKNFNDVIRLVRQHFLPLRSAPDIYLEIFDGKQADDSPIHQFVSDKRVLFSQLPNGRHDEESELDMLYGSLNIKYRKHISRNDFKTFVELLEKGRLVDSIIAEE